MIGIDLGSNTLRVVQIDCESGERVSACEKIVKTADALVHTGKIDIEAQRRVIAAVIEARKQIDFENERYRAVTTEAMRQASNRDEVLAGIEKETGIVFEIIGGEEEAKLTLLAVEERLCRLGQGRDSFLLVDIGGGSTELIFTYRGKHISRSFPVGIVTVSQRYGLLEAIEEALPALMKKMQLFYDEVVAQNGKIDTFVATAGTPTTVAALKLGQNYARYDPESVNGTELTVMDLNATLKQLLTMSPGEREIAVGVGRSDLIAAGILIFRELFSIAGMEKCIVIDDGLREGVALEGCRESGRQKKEEDL